MCDPSRITLRKSAAEVAVPIEGVPADEHAYTITLPHELFSSIYHNYKSAWQQVIMPGQNYLDRFWQAAKNLPQWADHPLARERSLARLLPLSIHGDETPICKGKAPVRLSSAGLPYSATFLHWAPKKASFTSGPPGTGPSTSRQMTIFLPFCCGLSRLCMMADSHTEIGGDSRSSPAVLRAAEPMACRWVARHSGGQLWRLGLHVPVSGPSKVEFKFPLLLVPVSETGSP